MVKMRVMAKVSSRDEVQFPLLGNAFQEVKMRCVIMRIMDNCRNTALCVSVIIFA